LYEIGLHKKIFSDKTRENRLITIFVENAKF